MVADISGLSTTKEGLFFTCRTPARRVIATYTRAMFLNSMLRSNEAVKGVPSTFDGLSELAPTGGHRFRHIASVAHRCCPDLGIFPIQKLRVIFATTTNSAGARPC